MQKQLGFLLGLFFISVAVVNFIDTPVIMCLNVLGLLFVGIAYIESGYFGVYGKVLQIATTVFFSALAVLENDPNSLVPVIAIIVAVILSQKYFPKFKSYYLTSIPLFVSLVIDWNTASIVNNLLLYLFLGIILGIIDKD